MRDCVTPRILAASLAVRSPFSWAALSMVYWRTGVKGWFGSSKLTDLLRLRFSRFATYASMSWRENMARKPRMFALTPRPPLPRTGEGESEAEFDEFESIGC